MLLLLLYSRVLSFSFSVSFLVLAHNLYRGAAGAAVLNAELCKVRGLLGEPVGEGV